MKHIKEAGLSPGLIYGMGGQGGSTQGAGAANGVGLPQDQSVGMGLRAQEIGVEMANALSQIKLNESQANKNDAEANKIRGVDTEAQQATIDNLIAQTSNEKIKRGLILGQIRVADAEEELKIQRESIMLGRNRGRIPQTRGRQKNPKNSRRKRTINGRSTYNLHA